MRAERGASDFIDFLEDTGRGIFGGKLLPYVQLEGRGIMCDSEDEVIRSIYTKEKVRTQLSRFLRIFHFFQITDSSYLYESCILATRNEETMRVNEKVHFLSMISIICLSQVISMLSGPEKVFVSVDTPLPGVGMQMAPEMFHDMMESGMPPHSLRIKVFIPFCFCYSFSLSQVGMIVILLRNLDIRRGLCNGTRMIVSLSLLSTFLNLTFLRW